MTVILTTKLVFDIVVHQRELVLSETSLVHRIRLSQDNYFTDYSDPRNKRFLARKLQIEKAVTVVLP